MDPVDNPTVTLRAFHDRLVDEMDQLLEQRDSARMWNRLFFALAFVTTVWAACATVWTAEAWVTRERLAAKNAMLSRAAAASETFRWACDTPEENGTTWTFVCQHDDELSGWTTTGR